MNVLNIFFGKKEKEQAERSVRVDRLVDQKKNKFIKQMGEIRKQAIRTHKSTRKVHEDSAKLLMVVDDITMQIDKATRL